MLVIKTLLFLPHPPTSILSFNKQLRRPHFSSKNLWEKFIIWGLIGCPQPITPTEQIYYNFFEKKITPLNTLPFSTLPPISFHFFSFLFISFSISFLFLFLFRFFFFFFFFFFLIFGGQKAAQFSNITIGASEELNRVDSHHFGTNRAFLAVKEKRKKRREEKRREEKRRKEKKRVNISKIFSK